MRSVDKDRRCSASYPAVHFSVIGASLAAVSLLTACQATTEQQQRTLQTTRAPVRADSIGPFRSRADCYRDLESGLLHSETETRVRLACVKVGAGRFVIAAQDAVEGAARTRRSSRAAAVVRPPVGIARLTLIGPANSAARRVTVETLRARLRAAGLNGTVRVLDGRLLGVTASGLQRGLLAELVTKPGAVALRVPRGSDGTPGTGARPIQAATAYESQGEVFMAFTTSRAAAFRRFTARNRGRVLSIWVDGHLLASVPIMQTIGSRGLVVLQCSLEQAIVSAAIITYPLRWTVVLLKWS